DLALEKRPGGSRPNRHTDAVKIQGKSPASASSTQRGYGPVGHTPQAELAWSLYGPVVAQNPENVPVAFLLASSLSDVLHATLMSMCGRSAARAIWQDATPGDSQWYRDQMDAWSKW